MSDNSRSVQGIRNQVVRGTRMEKLDAERNAARERMKEQAEAKWAEIRQALDGVIDYEDGWTADMIDKHENEIVQAVLDAVFDDPDA